MINTVANTVLALALFGACALGQDQGQSRTVAGVRDVPADNARSATSLRQEFEFGDRSPVSINQSSPYYWKTAPVGDGAQLLTLFCRACGVSKDTEEDVPLVSVLRDTLGYDHAIADYDEALRLDPKHVYAYNNRGNAFYQKDNYDRAIADFDEAIRLDPKYADAYNGRGNAYNSKGDHDAAIADYSEVIQLNPKLAPAYVNRGSAYIAKGDYGSAIANFSEAIQLDPKLAAAHHDRGRAYNAKGDYDRAIADYSEAIRLDPKYAKAYFARGISEVYFGALPNAVVDFNQASELAPKSGDPALWLDIVNKRSNLPSRLSDATKQIDMTKWPAPIIRLYLGQLTPEAIGAATDDIGKL